MRINITIELDTKTLAEKYVRHERDIVDYLSVPGQEIQFVDDSITMVEHELIRRVGHWID